MTWTRAVMVAATLAVAVVVTQAQTNPASSNLSQNTSADQKKDKTVTPPPAQEKSGPTKPDGDYVGSETCAACHQDQSHRFNNTTMGKAMAHPRTPDEARGCESCHGPGKVHVEAGGGKDTIPVRFTSDSKNTVAEKNAACLQCHSRKNQMFWRGSPHESRAMACVDCHQAHQEVHATLSDEARFNAPLTDTRRPEADSTRTLLAMSPDAARTTAALFAHAVSGRKGNVHQLS